MSDVAYSPAPTAPAAPAPAPAAPSQGEAVINPNPTHIPGHIGSQAPEKPQGESMAPSRRDAIDKAFQRASVERKGPAKAQMGHNQPPEPTEKEPLTLPKIDLKRRPDDQPQAPPRERGEHGHFAPREQERAQNIQGFAPQPGQQSQTPSRADWNIVNLPPDARHREPPRRWSEQARAEWGAAPESVRAHVRWQNKKFSEAYGRLRADHESMNEIRQYHDLARQQGTTLGRVLGNYTGIEHKLRSDPIGGLDVIVNNLNLRTADGQRLGLRDIAWHVLNRTPEQHALLQNENTQTAFAHQMAQMRQQQAAIAQEMQQLHYERRFTRTRGQVDQFAETHPRLDELGKAIEYELRLGFDLPTAYARADRLYPATHAKASAAQTRTSTAQPRSTDRSISGAPAGNGAFRRNGPVPSRRDAAAMAIRQVNGSL